MRQSLGIRKQFGRWLWLLSTMLATVSFVSFLQHVLDVGVGPLLGQMLAFYRNIFYPIIDFLASVVSLRISQTAKDAFILTALTLSTFQTAHRSTEAWTAMGASVRVILVVVPLVVASAIAWLVENELSRGVRVGPTAVGRFAIFVLALPLSVVIPVIVIRGWFQGQREVAWEQAGEILTRYCVQLLVLAAAVAVVFALNWSAPPTN